MDPAESMEEPQVFQHLTRREDRDTQRARREARAVKAWTFVGVDGRPLEMVTRADRRAAAQSGTVTR